MTVETIVSAPLGVAGEYPSHQSKLGKGGVHIFLNTTERDAMWDELKVDNQTVALVKDGENKYPSWYIWTGTEWEFAGYFGGIVVADADGALTNIDSTAVFGPDFKLQAAGSTGNGALLMLSDEVKAELAKRVQDGVSFTTGPYLELVSRNGKNVLEIKPMSFEPRRVTGYLAYMQYPEFIRGKAKDGNFRRAGVVWPDMVKVSANGMLQIDRDNKAIGLQETDQLDPNVTGGSKFLVFPFIYLEGNAPDDGYVELMFVKRSDGTIATDVNGHPLAVRHNYKQGDELTPAHNPLMLAQVMAAKGLTEYDLVLVDNFDEYIKVKDYSEGPSGICIQELSKDGTSSEALLTAQIDTGMSVRVENYYVGSYLATIGYMTGIDEAATSIKAGSRANTVAGIEMYAVTDTEFAVNQGMFQINSSGKAITDFYIGLELTNEVTRILAGSDIEANLALVDKDDGWNVGFFAYTGDTDKRPPIYSARNNGSIILNKGWTQFSNSFITEDAVSGVHSHSTAGASVPKNADQIMVAIYPVQAQQPCDLSLKMFHVDAVEPHDSYAVNALKLHGLQHLDFMSKTVRLAQGVSIKDATTGSVINRFAGLRYTINDSSQPAPLGVPERELAYLTIDKSKNVISGSSSQGGEGALVASEHVELTTWQKWQLYNEQASEHEVQVWLEVVRDSTGQTEEVPHSRTTFSVDPKRQGVDYFTTNKVTVTLEAGDYVYARFSSDAKDGAYAQTNSSSQPLCITYLQEKYLG